MLRQMLTLQLQLSDSYRDQASSIRSSLMNLASNCLPDYIESCLKSGNPLENQPIDFLTSNICQHFIDKFQVVERLCNQYERIVIPELKQTIIIKKEDAVIKRELIEELETQIKHEENQLDVVRKTINIRIPEMELYQFLTDFQSSETFERDREALEFIGTSGSSRVPVIKNHLAKSWNVATSKARSIDECLNRLSDRLFLVIEQKTQQEQTSSGGRYPHILSLTAIGSAIYQELLQTSPKPGVYDELLKRHKSPEHTLLIMQTADFMENEGYQIDRFPKRYLLDGGHYAEPDLLFQTSDQEQKLLEVERGGNKANRTNKWLNLYHVGKKAIYVVADNKKAMGQIRSEICKALGTKEGVTYMTNMFELLKGKRETNGGIWLDIRQR